ncbi:MAG: hypothetical protein L0323_19055 [Planctomycetes bacterium]|nr:hypothetical protein [Planctomycetota bacterium]
MRKTTVAEFIGREGPRPGARCLCCADRRLRAAIKEFLDARDSGKTRVSLNYFHAGFIVPTFGRPRALNSFMNHVRRCPR